MANGRIPDPENRPPNRRGGGWWWAWWWMWLFVIIILAAWFVGWGWWGYGGWWGWGNGGRQAVIVQQTGPGLAVLDSNNRQQYVGQPFRATGVTVQNAVDDHAYWIRSQNATPMLAVTAPNQNAKPAVANGSRVTVIGTVRKAPPEAQAKQAWGLNQNQANRLEQQGAYVQVSTIQLAEAGGAGARGIR